MKLSVSDILKSEASRVIISLLLGIGAASLFRKGCHELSCLSFRAPDSKDISEKTYVYGESCLGYKPRAVPCEDNMVKVKFD